MIHRTLWSLLIVSLFVARAAADEPQPAAPQTKAPRLEAGPYRVTSTPRHKLAITITHNLPPMQGVVYFPFPPDTVSQKVTACKMTAVSGKRKLQQVKAVDSSPLRKPIHEVVLKHFAGGKSVVELDIDLFAARLEPGISENPMRPLPKSERIALTAVDWHYEYDTGHFRKWMADKSLTRGKAERDADFALRVLEFIRRNFEYKIPDAKEMQDQIASLHTDELGYYISEKAAECWGLSSVYTSVLRANGIPCRQMSGFLIDPAARWRGDHHVRAEVHMEGIGWILVEVAGAVTAKKQPLLAFFGHPGDDMVLINQGVNYRLAGPREPGRIGTFSGFAIANAGGEWSFPFAEWEITARN